MDKKNKIKNTNATPVDYRARAATAQSEYGTPVDVLFAFGEVGWNQKWPDYSTLEFSDADVPELVRLACDTRLDLAESFVVGGAPIHAMRILALRGHADFLPALFATFDARDDDDLFNEDIARILATIGATAIPFVQEFFDLPEKSPFQRASLSNGLVAIARKQRSVHARVVDVLVDELSRYENNSEEWNGFLIADLTDLAAGEALPLIEQVFAADAVDEMICGDLKEVRSEFGLEAPRRDNGPLFLKDARAALPNLARSSHSNKTLKP